MAGRFSIEAIFRAVDRFTGPVLRMQTSMSAFAARATRSLRTVEMGAATLGSKLDKIGGTMLRATGALVLPVAAASAVIGKLGSDFEQAITNVGAVNLMTRDQISDLEAEALRLGSTTKFTATQAAEGMEILARAGFTNNEILQATSGVLSAAAAEGIEMAEVANHVSNVLKGMGKSADDAKASVAAMGLKGAAAADMVAKLTMDSSQATRVADVLALASALTNSSISSLGESMANVAASARQLNIPLESVVASVAALQDVGLDASVAGSAVNTMLSKMSALTAQQKAQLRSMGVAFEDAKGNALPFGQIIAGLAKGGAKSGGNMRQLAFFTDLVGMRGQKAASNLADLFRTGKLESLIKALDKAGGSAQKMADIRMQTAQGQFLLLKSAIEGVAIELYKTESGPLRDIVTGMKSWVDQNKGVIVSGFVDFMKKVHDNMGQIHVWLKRIAIGVGIFMALSLAAKAVETAAILAQGGLWLFRGAVWAVNAAIFISRTALDAYRTAMLLYTLAAHGANGATWAMLAPIIATTVAVAAAAAAVIWLAVEIKKLMDVAGGLQGLMEGLSSWASGEGFFEGIDAYQNKIAKQEAEMRKAHPVVAERTPGAAAVESQSQAFRMAQTGFSEVDPAEQSKMFGDLQKTLAGVPRVELGAGMLEQLTKLTQSSERFGGMPAQERTKSEGGGERSGRVTPQLHLRDERKTEHTEKVEISVAAQPGTDVKVTTPPKGKNVRLQLGASGAF